ncbi:MAG: hypothetical protein O3B72_10575 [Proteobacteria bacterium]|nr:hypothetical protein [Pseudomonadota bacterium]
MSGIEASISQVRTDSEPAGTFPLMPEGRPRSRYAITRDTAVTASQVLVEQPGNLKLADGAEPHLEARTVGEMHTCWQLPVTYQG